MELVANVWPIADAGTGLVLRYIMRAYAMSSDDSVINATLRALAPTDFRIGRVFTIPKRFTVVSEHGELSGCVTIGDFQRCQAEILARAFTELEKDFARLQGIGQLSGEHELAGIGVIPRFPETPYLVVTTLLELPSGELVPQIDT